MTDFIIGGIILALLIFTTIRIVKSRKKGACIGCAGCAARADHAPCEGCDVHPIQEK